FLTDKTSAAIILAFLTSKSPPPSRNLRLTRRGRRARLSPYWKAEKAKIPDYLDLGEHDEVLNLRVEWLERKWLLFLRRGRTPHWASHKRARTRHPNSQHSNWEHLSCSSLPSTLTILIAAVYRSPLRC